MSGWQVLFGFGEGLFFVLFCCWEVVAGSKLNPRLKAQWAPVKMRNFWPGDMGGWKRSCGKFICLNFPAEINKVLCKEDWWKGFMQGPNWGRWCLCKKRERLSCGRSSVLATGFLSEMVCSINPCCACRWTSRTGLAEEKVEWEGRDKESNAEEAVRKQWEIVPY